MLVQHSSETNDWFTPESALIPVRQVLGTIDLDPASCALANEIVQAKWYYTIDDDGLNRSWQANTVFLNPPYGKTGNTPNAQLWITKLISEYKSGNIKQAILLVNANTDTDWFKLLWRNMTGICFKYGRIRFYSTGSVKRSPAHANVYAYFGSDFERFRDVFKTIGAIVKGK